MKCHHCSEHLATLPHTYRRSEWDKGHHEEIYLLAAQVASPSLQEEGQQLAVSGESRIDSNVWRTSREPGLKTRMLPTSILNRIDPLTGKSLLSPSQITFALRFERPPASDQRPPSILLIYLYFRTTILIPLLSAFGYGTKRSLAISASDRSVSHSCHHPSGPLSPSSPPNRLQISDSSR